MSLKSLNPNLIIITFVNLIILINLNNLTNLTNLIMRNIFITVAAISLLLSSCFNNNSNNKNYKSEWNNSPDGVWAGPGLWANRLQDWKVENGKLECINTKPMRTVHLTTYKISEEKGNISSSIKISSKDHDNNYSNSSAGFIGAGSGLDYRKASLIHHSYGPLAGIYLGLDLNGNLFIRDCEKKDKYFIYNNSNKRRWTEASLILNITPSDENYKIDILAVDPGTNSIIDRIENQKIPGKRLIGSLAIVSDASITDEKGFSFSDWRAGGTKLDYKPDQNIGPIMGVQYLLSKETLKITAQMAPIGRDESSRAKLELMKNNQWQQVQETEITDYSFLAKFSIGNWIENQDIPFRIVYSIKRSKTLEYTEEGVIKHDPVEKDTIVILSLSCVEQVIKPERNLWAGVDAGEYPWDWGVLYPHVPLTKNLEAHRPDLLFFAGDQVYEGASPTVADRGPLAHLDYLYKWYLWCQTYKELTLVCPSITIPDDHDVYHGNLWGAGGVATPEGLTGAAAQDAGGYKMSPGFVNMVQETQTSHLPDPYNPEHVEQEIGVYYTECNIGGVSFAILEDRKFKSAPKALLPEAEIINGWPGNTEWNVKRNSVIEADLLGERQLVFLQEWAEDWSIIPG